MICIILHIWCVCLVATEELSRISTPLSWALPVVCCCDTGHSESRKRSGIARWSTYKIVCFTDWMIMKRKEENEPGWCTAYCPGSSVPEWSYIQERLWAYVFALRNVCGMSSLARKYHEFLEFSAPVLFLWKYHSGLSICLTEETFEYWFPTSMVYWKLQCSSVFLLILLPVCFSFPLISEGKVSHFWC